MPSSEEVSPPAHRRSGIRPSQPVLSAVRSRDVAAEMHGK